MAGITTPASDCAADINTVYSGHDRQSIEVGVFSEQAKKCPREALGSHVGELSPINGKGEKLFHSSHQQGIAGAW